MKRLNNRFIFLTRITICLGIATISFADDKAAGNKKNLVNVEQQKLYAVQAYKLVYEFDVVTGKPG